MKGKKIRGKEGMKVNAGQDGWSRADQREKKKKTEGGRMHAHLKCKDSTGQTGGGEEKTQGRR